MSRRAALLLVLLAGLPPAARAGPGSVARDTLTPPSLDELVRLYEGRQYFRLRDLLGEPSAEESPGLRVLRAAAAHAFNELERSNALLEEVLSEGALTDSLRYEARRIQGRNLLRLHRYAEARETFEALVARSPAFVDSSRIEDFRNYLRITGALEDVPPLRVDDRSTTVLPRQWERGGREVTIDGTSATYGVDTGASFSVLIRSEAERLGLVVRPAGVEVGTEPGVVTGDLAVADRLQIGGIELRNVVFLVLPDAALTMPDLVVRGLLGFPVAEALGELRYRRDGSLEVPGEVPVRGAQNLAFHELAPYVRVGYRRDDLLCRLDTGGHATTFYEPFFRRHRTRVRAEGTPDTARFLVAGGKQEIPSYRLDDVTLRLGGRSVTLPEVHVFRERVSRTESSNVLDCNVGADVLSRADEYIFNFRSMSVLLR